MIEGSGSVPVPLTNGFGSGRPKNIWIPRSPALFLTMLLFFSHPLPMKKFHASMFRVLWRTAKGPWTFLCLFFYFMPLLPSRKYYKSNRGPLGLNLFVPSTPSPAVLIGWDPTPLYLGSYKRALLVSQDRRHLFVTSCFLHSDRRRRETAGDRTASDHYRPPSLQETAQ